MAHPLHTTLILDLGDVLFRWSPNTTTRILPRDLRQILSSATWFEYECGRISQAECYSRVGTEFHIAVEEIAEAFKQARESLRPNEDFLAFISQLRTQLQHLRVVALSNISLPDYDYIMSLSSDWTTAFDRIFPSALLGERKPHLGAFRHVIKELDIDPQTAVFVDDKHDNVASARSLGMHAIVFDDQANVFRQLRNIFGDPIRRGNEFLRRHAGKLESVTDSGVAFEENFTQLMIYEVTNDRSLVQLSDCPRTWNFFRGKPLFSETFPDDVDTTSFAWTVLHRPDPTVLSSILDEMVTCIDSDGIVQTYFDSTRPRMDPFVCVNVLSLFFENGRGHQLTKTLDWVYDVLLYRAYHGGSRYYMSADCFLFFMSRLLQRMGDPDILDRFRPLFVERVTERTGLQGDSLDLAFRILAGRTVGIEFPGDLDRLRAGQCDDGGWELGWFYMFGSTGVRAGNRGLTTALAVKAIDTATMDTPPSPTVSDSSGYESPSSPVTTTSTHSSDSNAHRRKAKRWSSLSQPVAVSSRLRGLLRLVPWRKSLQYNNVMIEH